MYHACNHNHQNPDTTVYDKQDYPLLYHRGFVHNKKTWLWDLTN